MDFMKVLDQTVREIKREVNLKVLKVPEIEQKVLDATSDEPWGPHGSALAEIAQETKKFTECQMIMNTLWARLADTGANWRHAYKALAVIEYLIGNGSERAVDDIIEHTFQISSLTGFEYVESNGKDMGINVRKKAETISALLNDREKIKVVRDKAATTRDKYFGLSSSGVTYKSSAASIGSSNFNQYDRFGGRSGLKEGERFKDSYKDKDRHGDERKKDHANETDGIKLKDEVAHHIRIKSSSNSKIPSTQNSESISKSGSPQMSNSEDDFDDFDPRGSSIAGPVSGRPEKVDLFADSLFIDLVDEPAPAFATTSATSPTVETDLFADATFVSAPASTEVKEVDLFAHQSAPVASVPSKTNLFDLPDLSPSTVIKPAKSSSTNSSDFDPFAATPLTSAPDTMPPQSETTKSSSFDPFSAVPLTTFDDSDFGAFTSHTGSMNSESSQDRERKDLDGIASQTSSVISSKPQKESFQVKSGIWADSLSRGLIDLNITAQLVSFEGVMNKTLRGTRESIGLRKYLLLTLGSWASWRTLPKRKRRTFPVQCTWEEPWVQEQASAGLLFLHPLEQVAVGTSHPNSSSGVTSNENHPLWFFLNTKIIPFTAFERIVLLKTIKLVCIPLLMMCVIITTFFRMMIVSFV